MGRLVEALTPEYGMQVAGVVNSATQRDAAGWPAADVAIDFSVGEAVPATLRHLVSRGTNAVIGTTGWQTHEPALREEVAKRNLGVVAAPNFAVGVNLFVALVERAAELMGRQESF